MRDVACPWCQAPAPTPKSAGPHPLRCGSCRGAFWVTVLAPLVSRTAPGEAAGAATLGSEPPTLPSEDLDVGPVAEPEPKSDGPESTVQPGTQLGGLHVLARLGGGGMGTVWLARQVSLDRNVAVKVLRAGLGDDPGFVRQFNREALAAAQLVHHNIAQVYDSGVAAGQHYFSMEYVDGESLSALLRRAGRLDPEVAAGYALQAARGLKFAHDRGMVHRDVKPANLLLNRDGVIKVADLGLVKQLAPTGPALSLASTVVDASVGNSLLGTPGYMAPEQIIDSRSVDHRADIYALGCTLYALIAGRPPFQAEMHRQVLAMHLTEPAAPLERHNHRVAPALSALVQQMLAKHREERPADMGEVIRALERLLGVEAGATFSPREEHAALLERCVDQWNGASWARRRRLGRFAFVVLSLAVVGGAAALGFGPFTRRAAVFVFAAVGWAAVINGAMERSALILRLRQWQLEMSPWGWLAQVALLAAGVGALGWVGWLRPFLETLGLGLVAALASYAFVDRRVRRERQAPLGEVGAMLRALRLRGLDEFTLQEFVCRYSGADWESFYEALFGYDAKLRARARWGREDDGRRRQRYGVWRDPLARFIDGRLERRRARRDASRLSALSPPGPDEPTPPTAPRRRGARRR